MKKIIALLNCHEDDVYCFRREIIFELVRQGYTVLVSCPVGPRLDVFRNNKDIIIENIDIDRRGTNPIKDISLLLNYVRLFRRYRPAVVCTFTIKPNIYGSMAADFLGIPHINNITGLGSSFQKDGFLKKLVRILYKTALKNSSKVFFQNANNMNTAIKEGMISKSARYECIPGSGVNLQHFNYSIKETNNSIVFNYIGRVLKDKGVNDYIEAARIIRKNHKNVFFNIIGFIEPSEPHYKEILHSLEEEDIIHYCGSVEDVRNYINAADAIIHPSTYGEGISNVLLETAASGRAVITTDVPGCRDTVDDGKSGFVYKAGDVSDLIEKIEKFISLSPAARQDMGMYGRKKVEKEFDRAKVVEKYILEIKGILINAED